MLSGIVGVGGSRRHCLDAQLVAASCLPSHPLSTKDPLLIWNGHACYYSHNTGSALRYVLILSVQAL